MNFDFDRAKKQQYVQYVQSTTCADLLKRKRQYYSMGKKKQKKIEKKRKEKSFRPVQDRPSSAHRPAAASPAPEKKMEIEKIEQKSIISLHLLKRHGIEHFDATVVL